MLAANELSAGYHEGPLFSDLTFTLQPGDRVGIVGPNGAGKSTLLRTLSGQLQPEAGSVVTDEEIGYLEQTPAFDTKVADYMDQSSGGLVSMGNQLMGLYGHMEEPGIAERVGRLQENFETRGGWDIQIRIESILTRLGAPADALHKTFGELSGGEQSRVLLAGQLINNPGILLLDEPTNNLDSEALEWLESYLTGYRGAVIMVSHDRAFLDNTATRIIEIDGSGDRPDIYEGGYTAYREEAARRLARLILDYKAQEKRDGRLADAIAKLTTTGARFQGMSTNDFYRAKASKVDGKRKALEHRLQRLRESDDHLSEPEEPKQLPLKLSGISTKGRRIVCANAVTLGYDDKPAVIEEASFTIHGRDRVAITGHNGAGKTTLLSAIAGNEANIRGGSLTTYTDFSYMSQTETQAAVRRSKDTVLDWFRGNVGEIYEDEAASLLVWFGFERYQLRQQVKTMSPGEINKLTLLGMTYSGRELLLLDEPTNHLDFDALDVTEHALSAFEGTLAVVSHDRAFLGSIGCNRMLRVSDKMVHEIAV
jgi:ATPase subunit of ABC transporter with duplicated ATPase domains